MKSRDTRYLQSRLYMGDLCERDFKVFSHPFPIHSMEYSVARSHDANGEPYDRTFATMSLTIELGETSNARQFLEKMNESEPSAFSVVFGGDIQGLELIDFRNLTVFWAYVVEARERFEVVESDKSSTFLDLQMHLHEIIYVSRENNTKKILEIHH